MVDADSTEAARVKRLIDDVGNSIKHLESELAPLLENNIEEYAAKLPALERAKWYTLIAYATNTIIFCCQKLDGMDPRNLPVYTELLRVKQYFEKIKIAENSAQPQAKPSVSLNKEAAGRFIKHGLSGNEKFDVERAAEQQKRKINAHIRFDQLSGSESKKRAGPDDTPIEENEAHTGTEDTETKDSPAAPASEHPTFNADSKVKHKHKKSSKKNRTRHKSSKPPRSSKAVFEDLLNRGSASSEKKTE